MKKFLFLPLCAASLACTSNVSSASPLVSIGDNADVFFNGKSNLRWSSNLFKDDSGEVDDLLLTVSPGLELNVGRGVSNADLTLMSSYDVLRYQDRTEVDTELAHVKALGSYESGRYELSASASFDENQSASTETPARGQLFESDVVRAGVEGEYRLSPKFAFGAGVDYSDSEYTSANAIGTLSDVEELSIPVDLFYELTPKLDVSLGYVRRDAEIGTGANATPYDQLSHFYNVGLRGELLPKLDGFLKLGYRENEFTDRGMFGADFDLTYAVSNKLTSFLMLSRDFGVGGAGDSTENSSIKLRADYRINPNYTIGANLGYDLRDYQGNNREDTQYSAGLSLSYVLNESVRFGAGYDYTEKDSTEAGSEYVEHALKLSASLRY